MRRYIEKKYKFFILFALGFMLFVSVMNAYWDSAIYDETAHIPAGYSYLTKHDMRLNPEHPPLIKTLSALPLVFINPNFDISRPFWEKNADAAQWEAGKVFLYESRNDPDKIIFWSRIPMILIALLLGIFIFKWTREISGIWGGLVALFLYSFDPNILGHNHFVTTDLGIAAFTTFAFYYFLRFIKDPSWKNTIIGGLFLGLMQLTKFSAVITFPIMGLLIIVYPLIKINRHKKESDKRFHLKKIGEYLGKGVLAFMISLVIVWMAYFLVTYDMPKEKLPEIISHYFHENDTRPINVHARNILFAMNESSFVRPMATYIFGVSRVFQRVAGGNVIYYFGEISNQGYLSYFPTVFLMKEPLPLLFLILVSLVFSFYWIGLSFVESAKNRFLDLWKRTSHFLRTHTTPFLIFFFVIFYSYTSITGKLNIGFRHLFPILPFVYILVAKTTSDIIKKLHRHQLHQFLFYTVNALIVLIIVETVVAYPFYTSYFNQLAGGPKNGYRYVTDSNTDWGQDLKRLKKFLEDHPEIEKIRTDYFGGANPYYYLGDKYVRSWDSKRPLEAGWYAISATFLQESRYDKKRRRENTYHWLDNIQPYDQVGTSILIYKVSPEDIKNLPPGYLEGRLGR